jgi:hypothetical protein
VLWPVGVGGPHLYGILREKYGKQRKEQARNLQPQGAAHVHQGSEEGLAETAGTLAHSASRFRVILQPFRRLG